MEKNLFTEQCRLSLREQAALLQRIEVCNARESDTEKRNPMFSEP